MLSLRRGLLILAVIAFAAASTALAAPGRVGGGSPARVEVVVTLDAPSLAQARLTNAYAARGGRRLGMSAPSSVAYLQSLAREQAQVESRIDAAIPSAETRWRYSVVLDGLAVVVPASEASRLARVPGVAQVYPSVRYTALLDRTPQQIGAPALWGPTLSTAGNGIKIGIIDDGLDQSHPFFSPAGFSMPAGFPKGQTAYTSAKVIVARAFPAPEISYANQSKPFDPSFSEHATHVAGIAAGDNGVVATTGARVSGIAPRAYLGNYKALTVPTPGVGLNGNSPEIAAAIEAAVRAGMDVINLSLGEPEIEPSRDLVVRAINGAADAGVVPAIAAGNDFGDFGRGSVGSPGTASKAITAAAVTSTRGTTPDQIADFSSGGPTPISLELKPDVSAPGVNVLSSVPAGDGSWAIFSGTSMASPHVAGAAALLKQRHPAWTVAQIKSALALTGKPVHAAGSSTEVATTREGGGLIDLPKADNPLVFAQPSSVSFGLVRRGTQPSHTVELSDAGGGAGTWSVTVESQFRPSPLSVAATVSVPGALQVTVNPAAATPDQELTGFVVLSRGGERRRIAYWLRVEQPRLASEPHRTLARAGVYRGTTAGKPSRVTTYRYPESPQQVATSLGGPEQVFRFRLGKQAANFGVVITSRGQGVAVTPRIVRAGDENRLAGYAALPIVLNPYLDRFQDPVAASSVTRPAPGSYDIVFDTPSGSSAGRFAFRFWIDDVTPPRIRLIDRSARVGGRIRFSIDDGKGSGLELNSVRIQVDGAGQRTRYVAGTHTFFASGFSRGTHTLQVTAADYQELKNNENVSRILANTRVFRARFTIR
ncbi:MAG: minor extracellular serine protease Vpr [Gaiellaceae bacterium]|nr:minor extracellular serine protease Vpr [Gaiellaceae bacterium]